MDIFARADRLTFDQPLSTVRLLDNGLILRSLKGIASNEKTSTPHLQLVSDDWN